MILALADVVVSQSNNYQGYPCNPQGLILHLQKIFQLAEPRVQFELKNGRFFFPFFIFPRGNLAPAAISAAFGG